MEGLFFRITSTARISRFLREIFLIGARVFGINRAIRVYDLVGTFESFEVFFAF